MSDRPRRTILIVEDSLEDQELYRRYLLRDQEYEYTIIHASLGVEGLDLWWQVQPDAVLLDYRLPDLDGLEFLAALQTQALPLSLPIVMVTGVGNEAIAVQAIKAGAQDYLIKGQITPESLQLTLDTTIKTVQLQTQLQQRIDRERVITQISQKVFCSLDLDQILHTTVAEVRQFLQTDRVVVFHLDSDSNGTVVAEAVGAEWRSILSEQIHDPCFVDRYIDRYRQGLITSQTNIYDGSVATCHVELLSQYQVQANLVVPILHDDQFWGVLIAHHCAAPRQWQPLEIDLLQQLSTQVSVAIRQAELYQQAQHELAERQRTEAGLQRAAAALQESEVRFRQLAENINAVFWLREEPEGRVSYVSSAYERLWGWRPEELYENPCFWLDHIHPDDRAWIAQAFASNAATGQFDHEYRIVLADGSIRWVHDRCFPLHDQAGRLYRFAGIAEDITDRIRVREALQHSEAFKNRVLESSSDCIKVLDLEGRLLYMNTGGKDLLEIDDLSSYLGSEWLRFWQEDNRVLAAAAFATAKGGEVGKFQGYCATVKGTPKWWDVVVTPIWDGSGQVIQLLSTSRDITEAKHDEVVRRQTEAELRQKNAILDVINESAPTPIFVKDRQGRIIYANPATLAVLGKPAAEVIGAQDRDLYPSPEDADRVMANDQRIMATGQMEVVEESPDGVRTFLGTKAPYYNEAGEVIGLIGIANEITDRVQIERDRERILTEKQAALAESERVNRIKDEFLAVLSHELRSPLNPILGWTKLLQTGKLSPSTTLEALATIERNAKVQTQLIDDLLDMARVLRGKLTLHTAPVSLVTVIKSAIDTVQTAITAKSIQIQSQLTEIGQVAGDAVRLQQIVWNLLTNAVKFTPSGGRVEVRLEAVDNQAQITVTDTGRGISPDFLPHIFESFRQEDASVTRKHGGLGLGMAIVYQLVEAHGGTITATSPGEGQGATFVVQIPLLNAVIQSQPASSSAAPQSLMGCRVLVIDDEPDSRQLLWVILTQAEAEVTIAASATEFLAALESFRPQILVSDIGMPTMDGYALLQQVRSRSTDQGGRTPAIALTAYAGEQDQQQAEAAGFQRHLSKPIEPDQLVAAIVEVLANR
jgi:PAS domain S-box-containing protein